MNGLFTIHLFDCLLCFMIVDEGRSGRRRNEGTKTAAEVGSPLAVPEHRDVVHRVQLPDVRLSTPVVSSVLAGYSRLAVKKLPMTTGSSLYSETLNSSTWSLEKGAPTGTGVENPSCLTTTCRRRNRDQACTWRCSSASKSSPRRRRTARPRGPRRRG
jgi:hypothetical protein